MAILNNKVSREKNKKYQNIIVVNEFSEGKFTSISQKIRELKNSKHPKIIHTNMNRVRGGDFNKKGQVLIDIAFNPKN